jgi:hypothetical protein
MITSIEIQGLRGIREGRIEGLAPLTILVGPNGCGKSTVLEACGVACAGNQANAAVQALASREWLGPQGLTYWIGEKGARIATTFDVTPPVPSVKGSLVTTLRIGHASATKVVVIVTWPTEGPSVGEVSVDQDGSVTATTSWIPFALQSAFVDRPAGALQRLQGGRFSSAHRDALTVIKLSPWYDELFSYLQILRPTLTSIESIAVGDRDEPHIFERDPQHGRVGYPLAYAGDGFRRSLLLAGTFARARGGVAAVDEPEAFAHPGMFDALTGLLRRAVSDGTQVVLATHSLEFVAAALRAFEDQPEKAAVVGLRMESGALDPVVVSGPDAHRRVLDLGHDLRL